ncbi:restriction endonuclease subunit S (plasmid) [Klebsiella sp. RHBSTW-00215]|uniref:restriction endonuclease subunit S n=1 Tax=Klebsiella sp. RHBSTW-00215 TaxID=2742640 RepID=UPI0015F58A9E|nr:restriction endonuclease subunit S [Klebsiella sp. RHBSTW-00215]MBA7935502.1 restriction endonuclease subunit S [Klebsiella sp. RHBSTW-00215]HEC2588901.1 restriction endonuclease subunit S [Raoultella ornithinolytica]HEC2624533.1 restriction endonuclease subunit S [Raoultella ornithinolytica]
MSELSYLEKLLDGTEVVWKTLDDISVKISSGGTPKTGVAEYYDGDIPWLRTQEVNFCDIWDTGVKITESGVKNSSAKWIPVNCVIIAMYGATVGKLGINKIPMTTNQACANIEVNSEIADYKYVFYFLSSQYQYIKSLGSGSQTNINAGIVKKLLVPIPCPDNPEKSLAIQSEIVRILDKFTALTAELTAELTARKKQYNYYRDQLLSFDEKNRGSHLEKLLDGAEVEWVSLGNLTSLRRGRVMSKGYFVDNVGDYPVYSSQTANNGMIGSIDTFDFDGEFVSWTTDGANAGTVFYRTGKFSITNVCGLISIKNGAPLNYKFLFYWLSTEAKKHVYAGMGNPKLMSHQVEKIPVPIPYSNNPEKSLAIQSEIVRILDKFNTLTNSISEGLPREIELRQQQYEYYRDLLFSFPKPEIAQNTH